MLSSGGGLRSSYACPLVGNGCLNLPGRSCSLRSFASQAAPVCLCRSSSRSAFSLLEGGSITYAGCGRALRSCTATRRASTAIEGNRVVDSGRSGIWVGELDGGTVSDNVINHWDQHPELPLFGINPQMRAQLLQDFTWPVVIHNSQNVETLGNHH
jgi:hypothetical protein